MRILLSAFACVPHAGSEGGAGWRWAKELANDHEVVLLTDISRRHAIEREIAVAPVPGLSILYFRPAWLRCVTLNSRSANFIYMCWQFGLLTVARPLHAKRSFDLVIHLTYGVFRQPCFLGSLGAPFVFGPVGGGEDAPRRLKASIPVKEKMKEWARNALNKFALIDPFLWFALSRTSLILVRTEETRRALPVPFRRRAMLMQEIGIDSVAQSICAREGGSPLEVIFVGRLLGWKGAHLALRAVHRARQFGLDISFTVVGRGPLDPYLHELARRLGLETSVAWVPYEPQAQLLARMRRSHVLLFPSLHDSGGNVVLEAQSQGLPVICLDLGGPCTLVSRSSAVVVPTGSRREIDVVELLAEALARLARDEPLRRAIAQAALINAANATWALRVKNLLHIVRAIGLCR